MLKHEKHNQLVHDLVINEDVCNMDCSYCMVPYSPLNRHPHIDKSVVWDYENNFAFREKLDRTLDNYHLYFDAPILKVSGGEILMVKHLEKLLIKESKRYQCVQLLTNGSLFNDEIVEKLKKIPNLHIQMSLDGHSFEMNSYRVKTAGRHRKLLDNLDLLVRNGLPVEIYCVLHNRNTAQLTDFLDWLKARYGNKITFICFPVRHEPAETYRAGPIQLAGLKRVMDQLDCYREILPPLEYLQRMYNFMMDGEPATGRCYIPYLMMSSFEDGTVTPCVYSWVEVTGNLANEPQKLASEFGKTASYRIRSRNPRRAPFCKQCFVDAFVYGFYIDHDIDLETLTWNRPILNLPAVKKRLKEFRTHFSVNREKER